MMEAAHARERRLIDRHFDGRSTPEHESIMRDHMESCPTCRSYYQRQLALPALDPRAPSAKDRIAAGLGFRAERPRSAIVLPGMALAGAAAALLLLLAPGRKPAADPAADDGFAARGSGAVTPLPALHVYRVTGATSTPLGQAMVADDELAFAYQNSGGYRHLLVVGVDEHGHQYWFHPDPDRASDAVPIAPDSAPRGLREAIRHRYDGRALRIVGIFTQAPISVDRARALVGSKGCAEVRAALPAAACVENEVRVGEP